MNPLDIARFTLYPSAKSMAMSFKICCKVRGGLTA